MYNLAEKLGSVVTIRAVGGQEYVGTLIAVDDEDGNITLQHLKMVTIADNQVYMIPFALTAIAETVVLNTSQIFAVMATLPETCVEYQSMIESESKVTEEELDDA